MIDLSLNEAEALATKVARGAGFSWGIAEDVGRAARLLVRCGAPWAEALLALARQAGRFDPPPSKAALIQPGGAAAGRGNANPLCPVRTALLLMDTGVDLARGPLRLDCVGLPIWLEALLLSAAPTPSCRVDYGDGSRLAPAGEVTITAVPAQAGSPAARRASIAPDLLAELLAIAGRTYVPESERSRARGAGGGSVDGE